jgi:hypothetical protein
MPLQISTVAGNHLYASPMVGPVDHVLHKKVDISGLTTDEVDAEGFLKPGVVFKESAGLLILVGAAAGAIFIVHEAVRLPITLPRDNTTLAAETGDCFVGVATHGLVNRDIAEDNMGRAYTANELTSFVTAGTHLAITTT